MIKGDEVIACSVQELAELELEHQEAVISPLLPVGGRMLLYGETGSCKSMVAATIADCITVGDTFLSRFKCAQGPVLWVQADMPLQEWQERVQKNLLGFRKPELMHQVFYPDSCDIIKQARDLDNSEIHAFCQEVQPILVIVDVLSQTHNLPENDNEIVQAVYGAWHKVIGPQAALLAITHENKASQNPNIIVNGKYAFSGAHKWLDLSSSSLQTKWIKSKHKRYLANPKAGRNAGQEDDIRFEVNSDTLLIEEMHDSPVRNWLAQEMRLRRYTKSYIVGEATDPKKWAGKQMGKSRVYEILGNYTDPPDAVA